MDDISYTCHSWITHLIDHLPVCILTYSLTYLNSEYFIKSYLI